MSIWISMEGCCDSETEEAIVDNMANYDLEEAIRRSMLDAKLKQRGIEMPSEIELEQFYK